MVRVVRVEGRVRSLLRVVVRMRRMRRVRRVVRDGREESVMDR